VPGQTCQYIEEDTVIHAHHGILNRLERGIVSQLSFKVTPLLYSTLCPGPGLYQRSSTARSGCSFWVRGQCLCQYYFTMMSRRYAFLRNTCIRFEIISCVHLRTTTSFHDKCRSCLMTRCTHINLTGQPRGGGSRR